MLDELLNILAFNKSQSDSIKKLLYLVHCHQENIGFDSKKTYDWINSLKFKDIDKAYEWLNDTCQKNMLRPKNIERLQHVPPDYIIQNLPIVIKYLERFGFIDEVLPKFEKYDAILLLGASEYSFDIRARTVITILHNGCDVPELYILSGDRDLWPKNEQMTPIIVADRIVSAMKVKSIQEKSKIYSTVCKIINKLLPPDVFEKNSGEEINEIRLKIKHIFENPEEYKSINPFPAIKWPNEMDLGRETIKMFRIDNIIEVFDVDTPKNIKGQRPNTYDTFIWFEKLYGKKFSKYKKKPKLLLISNQSYNLYQYKIAESALPKGKYELEIVGKSSVKVTPHSVAVCLDSLARIIYASAFKLSE